MSESFRTRLVREPEPIPLGLMFVGGATLQFAIYAYYGILHEVGAESTLVTGSMFLVIAIPEFLPVERGRLIGMCRVAAIGYASIVLAYVLLWY